jgi:uncharacterized protein
MSPCRKCSATCCKYFALQIDSPRSKSDFDNLRWYLAHKKTAIFYEKRKWYLEIFSPCAYLTADNMCTIYHKRPEICRAHSVDECEFTLGAADHELYFHSLEELDTYIKERFRSKKTTKKAKPKSKTKPKAKIS